MQSANPGTRGKGFCCTQTLRLTKYVKWHKKNVWNMLSYVSCFIYIFFCFLPNILPNLTAPFCSCVNDDARFIKYSPQHICLQNNEGNNALISSKHVLVILTEGFHGLTVSALKWYLDMAIIPFQILKLYLIVVHNLNRRKTHFPSKSVNVILAHVHALSFYTCQWLVKICYSFSLFEFNGLWKLTNEHSSLKMRDISRPNRQNYS